MESLCVFREDGDGILDQLYRLTRECFRCGIGKHQHRPSNKPSSQTRLVAYLCA